MPLLPWPPGFSALDQSHQRPQIQSWEASHRHPWCWSAAQLHFRMLQYEKKKRYYIIKLKIYPQSETAIHYFKLNRELLFEETYSWRNLWARSHRCHVGGCRQKADGCLGSGQSACCPCHQIQHRLCHLQVRTKQQEEKHQKSSETHPTRKKMTTE